MKIFITWSGRYSLAIAEAWHEWLPSVLQGVKPFLSTQDIRAGARWARDIATQLEATTFGLICLTQENLNHPWVYFEAGAIGRSATEGRVAVLVADLKKGELPGPLQQFQATALDSEADVLKLVRDINALLQEPLDAARLEKQFGEYFPDLTQRLQAAEALKTTSTRKQQPSPTEQMFEQILTLLKDQQQTLVSLQRHRFSPEPREIGARRHHASRRMIEDLLRTGPSAAGGASEYQSILTGAVRDFLASRTPSNWGEGDEALIGMCTTAVDLSNTWSPGDAWVFPRSADSSDDLNR